MGRAKKNPPRSPLKDLKRKKDFGKVKRLGATSIENIAKRGTLKFLRERHPDWGKKEMIEYTGFGHTFVYKQWDLDSLEDKPRCGAPRTARTPAVMKQLADSRGRLKDNSNRTVSKKLSSTTNPISKSSVSRGFLELGLPYFRRPSVSRLSKRNKKERYDWSRVYRRFGVKFWSKFFVSDEKNWYVDGYSNPQNQGVRETSAKHVQPKEKSKFPGHRMSWLGITPYGTSKLIIIPPGQSVNGDFYQNKILKPTFKDIKSRAANGSRIDQKKLFRFKKWIFEQDFAPAHSTKVNEKYLSENTPNHTPTLRSLKEEEYWMPPKLDDFWPIERLWAIWANQVFAYPEPKTVNQMIRRVRKAHRETTVKTLTKLFHELPARCNEIYRQKGGRIPASWDYHKSPHRCQCKTCSS